MINTKRINELQQVANRIRSRIIENSHVTNTPHLGSCLSCVDILTVLYEDILNIDPAKPLDPNRDRFILSKGHAAPTLYQILAEKNFFSYELLDTYNDEGSIFANHPPTPSHLAGIEAATGSLGHGFSIGVGMALAGKYNKHDYRVFVVLSDGECNEGSIWEAAMFAPLHKLENLVVIIDYNKWQATGRSNEIMSLYPLKEKWESFGWYCYEIDGHNYESLLSILKNVPDGSGKPMAIIANTIKGKGVSFMEDDNNWHYRIPTMDEVNQAKKELLDNKNSDII